MFMEFCLTEENLTVEKIAQAMVENKVLCNISPITSIIKNLNDEYSVETGAKVTVFDIAPDAMVDLWLELRKGLGIHCVWLDANDYSGCICNWPEYTEKHCKRNQACPMRCSEYE